MSGAVLEAAGLRVAYGGNTALDLPHLALRPGELVGVVGANGAGKSTLVSLILRFYDPQSGQVRIDGKPAAEYDLDELRARMALVPQDVLLFGGTIAENIAYGRPGAAREEVEEAARATSVAGLSVARGERRGARGAYCVPLPPKMRQAR